VSADLRFRLLGPLELAVSTDSAETALPITGAEPHVR
jgi:hypothetical protein